jgi:hypothetical protein
MELSKADKEIHDQMLRDWIQGFKNEHYTQICAALPDSRDQPMKVGNSIPDLTALNRAGIQAIGEVKTCNDIDNDHTRGQLNDYLKTRSLVMLLVPNTCLSSAQTVLRNWGLIDRVQTVGHSSY